MTRLIDADMVAHILAEMANEPDYQHIWEDWRSGLHMAMEAVNEASTVDAVEVVRCKDCIHYEEKFRTVGDATGKVYCGGDCYHWDYETGMSPNQVDGDDFCSYGERRDVNEE